MSNKKDEKEYQKSFPGRFSRWMKGEKDPFIGTMEMKPQKQRKPVGRIYEPSDYSEIQKKTRNYAENKRLIRHGKTYRIISIFTCLVFAAVLLWAVSWLPVVGSDVNPADNEVPRRYIEQGLEETGAVNIVAGMILNYRAFDTFGESNVLFTATCCVMMILLLTRRDRKEQGEQADIEEEHDPILGIIAKIVCPILFLFGIYVVLNGHLSPGGGFSGGAIIGGGLILYQNAFGFRKTERFFTARTNKWVCFFALTFYCLSKSYSFYTGANHLESGIPNGVPGAILSGGLILPLNICVGAVVACTMYTFYALFRKGDY